MADDKSQLIVQVKTDGVGAATIDLESLAVAGGKVEDSTKGAAAGAMAAKEALANLSTVTEGLTKSATNYFIKQQQQVALFGQSAEYSNAYTATMKGMNDAQVALASSLGAQIDLQKASATANKDLAASTLDVAKANAVLAETEEARSVRLRAVAEDAVARQAAQRLEQTEERERILAKDAERSKMSSAGAAGSGYATAHTMTPSITRDEAAVAKAAEDAEKLAIEQEAMASTADKLLAKYDPLNYKLAQNAAMIDQVTNKTAALNWTEQQTKDVLAGLNMEKVSLELKKTEQAATAAGKGMEGFSMGSAKAKTEFVTLIREIMRGDFSRIPGTLSILTAQTGMMGTAMAVAASPITWVVVGLTALGVASLVGASELTNFNKSMVMTGNYSALTADQFARVSKELGNIGTEGQHGAAVALEGIAASGKFTSDQLITVGKAAITMQEATGRSVQDTVAEFNKLAGDPVRASLELNDQYHYLTVSVYEQIRALEDQGRHMDAVNLAINTMANSIAERAPEEVKYIGTMESAWKKVLGVIVDVENAALKIGRNSPEDRINALQDNIKTIETWAGRLGAGSSAAVLNAIKVNQTKIDEITKAADRALGYSEAAQITAQADSNAVKSAALARDRLDSENKTTRLLKEQNEIKAEFIAMSKGSGKKSELLEGVSFGADGNSPSGGAYDTEMQDAKNRIMGKGRTPRTNDDAQRDQIAQQETLYAKQEQDLAQSLRDIKNLYDIGVSDQKTFIEQTLERKDEALGKEYVIAAKEYEIAKGEKNIAAKEAYAKKMQTIIDKMVNNSKQYEDDIAKIDAKSASDNAAYSDKLEKDSKLRQDDMDEALKNAKLGTAASAQNAELLKIQKAYDTASIALLNEYRKEVGGISVSDYEARQAALDASNERDKAAEQKHMQDMKDIDADWIIGYKRALSTLNSSVSNVATQSETVFNNAFTSMGDAIANFATTGKLNFKSLAASILSDIAKMEAKAATSQIIGMVANMMGASGGAQIGGASGASGAATSFGVQPGSTYGALGSGFSSVGSVHNKYGNAFDGGYITKFADGGSFTNGVVSSPTNFNMGLMGEAGPEAIVPLTRTSDGSLGVKQTGGGSSGGDVNANTVINIASSGTATSSTSGASANSAHQQFASAVSSAVQTEIVKQMRQGGSLWKMRNGQTGT